MCDKCVLTIILLRIECDASKLLGGWNSYGKLSYVCLWSEGSGNRLYSIWMVYVVHVIIVNCVIFKFYILLSI